MSKYKKGFSSPALVQLMCNRLEPALSLPEKTVLEPGCGSGNFLVEIFQRRLKHCHHPVDALQSLANLYGVDIMPAHVQTTRRRLNEVLADFIAEKPIDYRFWPLAELILTRNFQVGDLLGNHQKIIFVRWRISPDLKVDAQQFSLARIEEGNV